MEERLDRRGREGFDSCFICAQGLEGKKDTVNVTEADVTARGENNSWEREKKA